MARAGSTGTTIVSSIVPPVSGPEDRMFPGGAINGPPPFLRDCTVTQPLPDSRIFAPALQILMPNHLFSGAAAPDRARAGEIQQLIGYPSDLNSLNSSFFPLLSGFRYVNFDL
ncbi:hypothetical protein AB1M95_04640 [Sulfitobacter sp. LCG007]